MESLPLNFKLNQRWVLVVGGGEIARRKATLLLSAGARIRLVAPEILPDLAEQVVAGGGVLIERPWRCADLDGMNLAISATDDVAVNEEVSRCAQARCVPVNVVDAPALCSVIFPAIVDRSPLIISVSSNGAAPVLARLVRSQLETLIPAAMGRLAGFMGAWRATVKAHLPAVRDRRLYWESLLAGPLKDRIFAGDEAGAAAIAQRALEQHHTASLGEVYLVGAGPGDPDLLTFKALRLMQQADVVVYDRLVAPEILDLCRRDAERIYAGKARADHALPQEDINALLVRLAQEGQRVCRLKGGDPFIFGRGGEEIEALATHGIPFQVVPGVTAASGCAAYAGIPLTHRDHAQSVRFLTGHLKDGTVNLPWDELIHPQQTLVLYMGLVSLPPIRQGLLAHGMDPETPMALVSQGTTSQQQVLVSTLQHIEVDLADHPVPAPTLIIIGSVVQLRTRLAWFKPTAPDNT